jgi:hypothetical protein
MNWGNQKIEYLPRNELRLTPKQLFYNFNEPSGGGQLTKRRPEFFIFISVIFFIFS